MAPKYTAASSVGTSTVMMKMASKRRRRRCQRVGAGGTGGTGIAEAGWMPGSGGVGSKILVSCSDVESFSGVPEQHVKGRPI